MASKLENNMNRAVMFHALLGLLVGVIARTYFHGLHQNNVEEKSYFVQHFDKFAGTAARTMQDGFVTLAVKIFNFFISKSLQFRYLPALLLAPSTLSVLFWVVFTRSISSMSDNLL